jgi:hypothetical protein
MGLGHQAGSLEPHGAGRPDVLAGLFSRWSDVIGVGHRFGASALARALAARDSTDLRIIVEMDQSIISRRKKKGSKKKGSTHNIRLVVEFS